MATTHSGINVAACLVLTASALAFVTVPIAGGRQEASDQKKPASIDVPAGDSSTLVYWNVLASGPLSIPITDNATITHTLDGNQLYGIIYDVTVGVRLNHTHDGDLSILVTAPNGTSVPLALNNGGSGDDYGSDTGSTYYTYFGDAASRRLEAGSPPYADSFRPVRPLSALDGGPAQGPWKLTIVDRGSPDVGTLLAWHVRISYGAAPVNFTGDYRPDLVLWRPAVGYWFIRAAYRPNFSTAAFGQPGDIPVPESYVSGSRQNQLALFRPSTGEWIVNGQATVVWGINGDIPVPGNYRGFDNADIAVWRPSTGTWYIKDYATVQWGTNGDIPVPADWNGGGGASIAVWRPSTGQWLHYPNAVGSIQWGAPGDIPVPADYIGDETADYGIFRPSNGTWYIRDRLGNIQMIQYGINGDIPVPADYDGDGKADIAVFRPSEGRFYIRDYASVQFGQAGDVPVVKRPSYAGYPY